MTAASENMPSDRDEQAASWCLAMSEGELRQHDRETFDRWIADPDNARAFEDAASVWNMADVASETPELIHMRSAALESYRRHNARRWVKQISPRWYWVSGIAATFLIAILTGALLYQPVQILQTGIGERRIAMLADGSKLSLDADTEVDVRLRGDRRDLTLVHGRAKFDVAHDPLRPFTVTAGDKLVVATGTSFSVEMIQRSVQVLLYEGHVAVLNKSDHRPVLQQSNGKVRAVAADIALTPGRELTAAIDAPAAASIAMADPVRSLSWESGQLSFDDEPLGEAVARMNRYSQQKFVVADDVAARVPVNGVFTAGDTDAFVEGVTSLNAVRADRDGDQITFRRN